MSVATIGQSHAARVAPGSIGGGTPSTSPWSIFDLGPGAASQWAQDLLNAGGLPVVPSNLTFVYNWAKREGGGGMWNPLNTTYALPGSVGLAGNSAGVQAYATEAQGIQATLATLQGYPSIVAALKGGTASEANSAGTLSADLSKWSGGGYGSVETATAPSPTVLTGFPGSGLLPGIITGGLAPGASAVTGLPGVSGIVSGVEGYLLRIALGIAGAVLIILALMNASHDSAPNVDISHTLGQGAEHATEEAAAA